jgi:hypothetical protein
MNDAAVHFNNAFGIRLDMAKPFITTDLTWGQIAHNIDSLRDNFVRYDTPILHGFMLSTAWNDDVWDAAFRYQNGSAGFRFVGGVGYMKDRELKFDDVRGSASLLHNATGLYLSAAGGWRDTALKVPVNADAAYFIMLRSASASSGSAGRPLYVVRVSNFNVGGSSASSAAQDAMGTLVRARVRRWGFGVEQAIDASTCPLRPGPFLRSCNHGQRMRQAGLRLRSHEKSVTRHRRVLAALLLGAHQF